MTKEELIRMAREAGGYESTQYPNSLLMDAYDLERFAALVAVQVEAPWQNRYLKLVDLMKAREGQPNKPCCLAEREACAKVADDMTLPDWVNEQIATAIRARSK